MQEEDYLSLLGALFNQGRFPEMEQTAREMTKTFPGHGMGWMGLGLALQRQGGLDAALAPLRKAVELLPANADGWNNLGVALLESGQAAEAESCLREAIARQPDHAMACNNLGNACKDQGRFAEAVEWYQQAMARQPDCAEACNNLGNIHKEHGHCAEAVFYCQRAIALQPDLAAAHSNLGNALKGLGRMDEAMACYRQAVALQPGFAEAHSNLGNALKDQGRFDAAESSLRRALALKPDSVMAYDNLLTLLLYHPEKSVAQVVEAHMEYNRRFGVPLRARWRSFSNPPDPNRRLRVGYLSPDFVNHSISCFVEPLLANHDKARFELFAYADVYQPDAVTLRYQGYVDHWVPTRGMTDAALAERVRGDGVDILVDLTGHTANNRLLVFAMKPAPVSVTWLYGMTTGLSAIDYTLVDETGAPPGSEGWFAEQPWRVATPAFAFRPPSGMGEVGPLPALTRGWITFGTLSRSIRLHQRVIRVWSELLQQLTTARLAIYNDSLKHAGEQEALAERFAAHGIGRERLDLGYHAPPWDALRGIDIGLDSFPHSMGTTLAEMLYMGIPMVSLAQRATGGGLNNALLETLGHPEWLTRTEDAYLRVAINLAGDLPRLAALRAGQRTKMARGPICDAAGFASKVEEAYRAMWQRWCSGYQ